MDEILLAGLTFYEYITKSRHKRDFLFLMYIIMEPVEQNLYITTEERTAAILGGIVSSGQFDVSSDCRLADTIRNVVETTGGVLHLVVPLCPDYSCADGQDGGPKFTFDSVNGEIGLVGTRILEATLPVMTTLEQARVHTNVIFAYADHEARDPEILEAMWVPQSYFEGQLQSSRNKLFRAIHSVKRSLNHFVTFDVCTMSDIGFQFARQEAELMMEQVRDASIAGLALERAELLSRFFRKSVNRGGISEFNRFILSRTRLNVLEHMQLSLAIRRYGGGGSLCTRTVFITMDPPALVRFYNFGMDYHIPVLCVKKGYQ